MRNNKYVLLLRVADKSLLHGPYRGAFHNGLDTSVGCFNTHRPLPAFDFTKDRALDSHCLSFLRGEARSKYLFGFLTPEQLFKWFKAWQRKEMLRKSKIHGFSRDSFRINFIFVPDEDIGKFDNQCIFVHSDSVWIAGSLAFSTSDNSIRNKWDKLSNIKDYSVFESLSNVAVMNDEQDDTTQIEMPFDYDDDKDYDIEPVMLSDYMLRDY
jgi:hypothetical protein